MNEEETEFNEPGEVEETSFDADAAAEDGEELSFERRRIAEAFTAYLQGFEPSQEFSVPAKLAGRLVVGIGLKFTVVGVNEASGIARIRAELE